MGSLAILIAIFIHVFREKKTIKEPLCCIWQEVRYIQQTLSKVKSLEKFIQKHGEDTFISQTISKMLDYKIQQYDKEIKRLEKDLRKFEWAYKKESAAFYKKFKESKTDDSMDFIEWAFLYQMRNRLLEKKLSLKARNKCLGTILTD